MYGTTIALFCSVHENSNVEGPNLVLHLHRHTSGMPVVYERAIKGPTTRWWTAYVLILRPPLPYPSRISTRFALPCLRAPRPPALQPVIPLPGPCSSLPSCPLPPFHTLPAISSHQTYLLASRSHETKHMDLEMQAGTRFNHLILSEQQDHHRLLTQCCNSTVDKLEAGQSP